MSTQPLEHRPLPVEKRRRPELRRVLGTGITFAIVFAGAFAIGHTGGSDAPPAAVSLPPGLPAVPTPVPSRLASVPAIAVGVGVTPPPVKHKVASNSKKASSKAGAPTVPVNRTTIAPAAPRTTTTVPAKAPVAPTPTPTVTPVGGSKAPPTRTTPAPASSPSPSSKGGESGSFDSSG
jgi:hypothetical protein